MNLECHHCHRSALTFEFSAWHPSGGIVARFRCGFCGRATTSYLPPSRLTDLELPEGTHLEYDTRPIRVVADEVKPALTPEQWDYLRHRMKVEP